MNLKKLLLVVGISIGAMTINAANYLIVDLTSGSKYSFLLSEYPVITFSKGDLVINDNAETSYSIADVINYHFSDKDASAVEDKMSDNLRIVSLGDGAFQVQNANPSESVKLINVAGTMIYSVKADENGSVDITLPKTKGVYVLVVGNKSLKVIRK